MAACPARPSIRPLCPLLLGRLCLARPQQFPATAATCPLHIPTQSCPPMRRHPLIPRPQLRPLRLPAMASPLPLSSQQQLPPTMPSRPMPSLQRHLRTHSQQACPLLLASQHRVPPMATPSPLLRACPRHPPKCPPSPPPNLLPLPPHGPDLGVRLHHRRRRRLPHHLLAALIRSLPFDLPRHPRRLCCPLPPMRLRQVRHHLLAPLVFHYHISASTSFVPSIPILSAFDEYNTWNLKGAIRFCD